MNFKSELDKLKKEKEKSDNHFISHIIYARINQTEKLQKMVEDAIDECRDYRNHINSEQLKNKLFGEEK